MTAPSAKKPERRRDKRLDLRTLVTIVAGELSPDSSQVFVAKGWSADISISGAQFLTNDKIPAESCFLSFLLPNATGRLVEAQIVRCEPIDYFDQKNRRMRRYSYAVRFVRLLAQREIDQFNRLTRTAAFT